MAYKVNERDIRFVLYEQLGIEKLFGTDAYSRGHQGRRRHGPGERGEDRNRAAGPDQ